MSKFKIFATLALVGCVAFGSSDYVEAKAPTAKHRTATKKKSTAKKSGSKSQARTEAGLRATAEQALSIKPFDKAIYNYVTPQFKKQTSQWEGGGVFDALYPAAGTDGTFEINYDDMSVTITNVNANSGVVNYTVKYSVRELNYDTGNWRQWQSESANFKATFKYQNGKWLISNAEQAY